MLLSCWLYLTRIAFRSELRQLATSDTYIGSELQKLGRASKQERRVLMVFCAVASAWILRGLVDFKPLALVHDSTIAITGALLLFLIPSNLARGEFLLDWKTAVRIPWDVIILFGGGFALAAGFQESGLTAWIGEQLAIFQGTSVIVLVFMVATMTIFLTELTSNTATASMLLPVIASLAAGAGIHPYGPMVAATLAASFAFMLPVATPPNAIVYASRCVTIQQMARAGFWLNLFGIVMIVLAVSTVLPLLWDFSLAQFPVGFPDPR
jgi:sodium-dependent dicarboxylate transporter 2/3/5